MPPPKLVPVPVVQPVRRVSGACWARSDTCQLGSLESSHSACAPCARRCRAGVGLVRSCAAAPAAAVHLASTGLPAPAELGPRFQAKEGRASGAACRAQECALQLGVAGPAGARAPSRVVPAEHPTLQKGATQELLQQWDSAANQEHLQLTPTDVTLGSAKPVHWTCTGCSKCGRRHSWKAPVFRRGLLGAASRVHASLCCMTEGRRQVCTCRSPHNGADTEQPVMRRGGLPPVQQQTAMQVQLAERPAPRARA